MDFLILPDFQFPLKIINKVINPGDLGWENPLIILTVKGELSSMY